MDEQTKRNAEVDEEALEGVVGGTFVQTDDSGTGGARVTIGGRSYKAVGATASCGDWRSRTSDVRTCATCVFCRVLGGVSVCTLESA